MTFSAIQLATAGVLANYITTARYPFGIPSQFCFYMDVESDIQIN